jgi:excisionase family DNA binding protein
MSTRQTAEQIAARNGVSARTITRLVAEEGLPSFRVGRALRFDPVAVDEWLASRPPRSRTPKPKDSNP